MWLVNSHSRTLIALGSPFAANLIVSSGEGSDSMEKNATGQFSVKVTKRTIFGSYTFSSNIVTISQRTRDWCALLLI